MKPTTETEASRPGSLHRLVKLRCRLTHEEHTLLMNILGMASNDPNDEDHAALESLREKIRDGSPAQPNDRTDAQPTP